MICGKMDIKNLIQKFRRKKKTLLWCDYCSNWVTPEPKNYGLGRYEIRGKTYYDIDIVFFCPSCGTRILSNAPVKVDN